MALLQPVQLFEERNERRGILYRNVRAGGDVLKNRVVRLNAQLGGEWSRRLGRGRFAVVAGLAGEDGGIVGCVTPGFGGAGFDTPGLAGTVLATVECLTGGLPVVLPAVGLLERYFFCGGGF